MSDYRRSPRQAGLAVPAMLSPRALNGGASASSSMQQHSGSSKAAESSYDGQHATPPHIPFSRVWRECVFVSSMHARRSLWKRLAADPRHRPVCMSACAMDHHRRRSGNSRGRRRTTQPLSISTDTSNGSSGMVSLRHAHQLSNINAGSSHVRSRSRRSNPTSDSTTPQQLTPRSTSDGGEQPFVPHSTPNSNQQRRGGGKRRRSTEMNTPRDSNAAAAADDSHASSSNSGRGRLSTRMDADSSASSSQKRKSGGRRSLPAAPQLPDAASSAHFLQATTAAAPAQPAPQSSRAAVAAASASSNRGRSRKGRRGGGGGGRGSNGNTLMSEMRDRDPYPSTGSSAAGSPAASPTRQQPQLLEASYYSSSRDAASSASGASFHASLQQQANELVQAPPAASTGGGFSSRNRGRGKGGNSRGRRSQQQQRRSKAETDHENDPPIGAITPGRLPAARYGTPYNSNAFLLNNVSRSSPDVSDLLVPAAAQYGSMSGLPLSSASPAISAAQCSPSAPTASGGVDDTMSDIDSVDEESSHGLSSINEESDAAAAAAAAAGVDNSWRDELTDAARKLKGATSGAETWTAPDTASLLQSAPASSSRRGGNRRGTRAGSRKKRRRTDKRGGTGGQQRNEAVAMDTAATATATAMTPAANSIVAQPFAASSQRAR